MVKGDAELKIFHSMLKYNDLFVAQNLSGNVITFMGGFPLEGRPWIFNIPRDNPWAWTEVKLFHSMLKYNDLFVAQNISGNVIAFMGDRPLEGKSCIFKIPQDKPWS